MGSLRHEDRFDVLLENGVKHGCLEQEQDTLAIEEAVKVLLLGLGEDINREGLKKTPFRVAKALRQATRGYKQKVKDIVEGALFPEAGLDNGIGLAGGVGGLVIVRDLDHFSYCESCMLPFQVKCHVGYIPSGQQVVGLSKLSRVVDVFAKRLQDPQRLADEVCSALHRWIKPAGVAIILQGLHIQFPNSESDFLDHSHQGWLKILVSSGSGVFEDENAEIWGDFLSLLKFRGVNMDKARSTYPTKQLWCPLQCSSTCVINPKPNPAMVAAVSTILKSLGEDSSRKELTGTPSRFVKWLMKFHNTELETKLSNGLVCKKNDFKANGDAFRKQKEHHELNLSLWSQCEHHLLPFHGVVHIGYLRAEGFNPIGRSRLQSIVQFYGFKLQVQERVTKQIAETVSGLVGGDVIVVAEASHTCMMSRGIEKFGSNTATVAVLGQFSTDPAARAAFLNSIPGHS